MPSLFAHDALLPDGWGRDVLLEWDDGGVLTRVAAGAKPAGAPIAHGPVLPGMANVHSHAFQRAMAGLAEWRGHATDDFWTWREAMYELVRRVTPDDARAIATQLYIEMLKHGYTGVGEFHYLHNDADGRPYPDTGRMAEAIVAAAQASGIALTLLPVLYAHGGLDRRPLGAAQRRFAGDARSTLALAADLRQRHPRVRVGIAPHSVRAVDEALLEEIVTASAALDPAMPIHMHLSEQVGEVEACRERHGLTPYAWIERVVQVDERWCFVHATHVTAEERKRIAGRGAVIGLCPTTESNLGDGIFDLAAWRALAGRWSIGGDSHVGVDPFVELRTLEYSQRLASRTRNVAADESAPDVATNLWQEAARGGARALAQPMGRLAVGCRADLVVLDGGDADFEALPAARALGVATFGGNACRVREVYAGGALAIREGRHDGEAAAEREFRAALRRLRS